MSVGNLAMGGRGKTPTVAYVSQLLIDAGERPAILSRGYRRLDPAEGVVVVSDGRHLRADLDRSGDEPLMLARRVRGASVLVSEVRATAAAVAETVLNATVHVLDDGFQHRSLARDIDLVLVTSDDLRDRRVPLGRLRSPVSALGAAEAVIVDGVSPEQAGPLLDGIVDPARTAVFSLRRRLEAPRWVDAGGRSGPPPGPGEPVVAVAGIANPARFRQTLQADGWQVDALLGFADHHRFRRRDLERIAEVAAGRVVLTTEKDAVRLLPLRPLPVPVAVVPLGVVIEPESAFRDWLADKLAGVRA